jgi:hypothetical protein
MTLGCQTPLARGRMFPSAAPVTVPLAPEARRAVAGVMPWCQMPLARSRMFQSVARVAVEAELAVV